MDSAMGFLLGALLILTVCQIAAVLQMLRAIKESQELLRKLEKNHK